MIRVLVNYGGVPSGGLRILPGLYNDDDPALLGLGGYLVANGHAVAEPDEPTPEPEPPVKRGGRK
jgi:hypothetical protein